MSLVHPCIQRTRQPTHLCTSSRLHLSSHHRRALCYWTCTLQRVLGIWTQFSYPLCHLLGSKTASWASLLCQTLWSNPTRCWNKHPGICAHIMTKVNSQEIRFNWSRNFYPLMRRSFRTQEGASKSRDDTRPCFKTISCWCSHHSKRTSFFWIQSKPMSSQKFFSNCW